MEVTHCMAKDIPITAPTMMTIAASPGQNLVRYHEVMSSIIPRNGSTINMHLTHNGLMYAWVKMVLTMKKMNVRPNRCMWDTRTRVGMLIPVSLVTIWDTPSQAVKFGR